MDRLIFRKTVYAIPLFALIATSLLTTSCRERLPVAIDDMRCEYLDSPICIDRQQPRFTWNYLAWGGGDFRQASFRIDISASEGKLTSDTGTGEVWSEEFVSGNSFAQPADILSLSPWQWYYWRVIVEGADGTRIVSPVAKFRTAMMDTSDWTARWITDDKDKSYGPAPMFRRETEVRSGLAEAYLYISAAAYYKMTINGRPVTDNFLDPGFTHYDKRNLYAVHDVTDIVESGTNALAVVAGNGFYNEDAPVATWDYETARWRNRARFICELHLHYRDGSTEVVTSDESFKTATGPYLYNNIYSGDTYDARLEMPGWDLPGFDDGSWIPAVVADSPSPLLVAQAMPAIRPVETLKAADMKQFGDTVYVYDFGVNMAGTCRLEIEGEEGTKVTLEYGELAKADGRIEMGNITIYYNPIEGVEFQTDTYILSGRGRESFRPDFAYQGFRYVEVRADRPVKLGPESLTAYFMHTDLEPVGRFECSNDLFNRIWAATNQTYLSNIHSIPTDCPQREKNGWIADGYIGVDIGLLNFDGIKFYEKWMDDFIDNQREGGRISGIVPSSGWGYDDWIGPVWDAALFIIPDALERYYGTTEYIDRIYPSCERYLQYLASRENAEGTVTYGLGDWVFHKTQTPTDYTTTCFYYLDNKLMAEFADKTGRDGTPYREKARELKELINRKYFDPSTCVYGNGSQTSYGIALYFDLVPGEYVERVAYNLNEAVRATDYYLDFGVLGSKFVPRMLTKYGYVESAYKMASKEDSPSWGGWINMGFTTLAETWVVDMVDFRDASLNHFFLGDISAWMVNCIAGINYDPAQRGFRHILFTPYFIEELDWAEGEYRSVNGFIRSRWERRGDKVELTVTVPVNTTATVRTGDLQAEVGAGTHKFTI